MSVLTPAARRPIVTTVCGQQVGDRGLEHYTLGLQASKVHTHELAGLEHDCCTRILQLRDVKCKPFPMGSCFGGRSRRNPYLHLNVCEKYEKKLGLIR